VLRLLLRGSPVLRWTAAAIAVSGAMALFAFWIYQKYWEVQGVPVSAFGYLWAALALAASVAARYASSLEARFGWRALLLVTAVLPMVGLLGMGFASGVPGIAFGFALQLSRGLALTLFYDALNRRIEGAYRATVNSLVSLGSRGVFIVLGPPLGWALDHAGVRPALLALALLFAPVLGAVLWMLGRRIAREQREVVPSRPPALLPAP
jgi:MFS family permease